MNAAQVSVVATLGFLFALGGATSQSRSSKASGWHTPPDQWEEPRVFHRPLEPEYDDRLRLSKVERAGAEGRQWTSSPNEAYRFSVESAFSEANSQWASILWLDTEQELWLRFDILDHGSSYPEVRWINEKLLYVSVWWGRALGTYWILDVESGTRVHSEMIHFGLIAFQQFQQIR